MTVKELKRLADVLKPLQVTPIPQHARSHSGGICNNEHGPSPAGC
jgi:hypothetical protein